MISASGITARNCAGKSPQWRASRAHPRRKIHVLTGSSIQPRLEESSVADVQRAAAVHQQRDAGDEVGLVGSQEQRGVRHVPRGAHLAAQRRARVSTAIGVSINPGRIALARTPYSAFWIATCSVKAIIAALVAL